MTQAAPTTLIIPQDLGGLRLDQALQRLLPEHSRSRLQAWIKEGLVTVDGEPSTAKNKGTRYST
jgi:23S rRNA pseudouridine1911/1915/1917 synthase